MICTIVFCLNWSYHSCYFPPSFCILWLCSTLLSTWHVFTIPYFELNHMAPTGPNIIITGILTITIYVLLCSQLYQFYKGKRKLSLAKVAPPACLHWGLQLPAPAWVQLGCLPQLYTCTVVQRLTCISVHGTVPAYLYTYNLSDLNLYTCIRATPPDQCTNLLSCAFNHFMLGVLIKHNSPGRGYNSQDHYKSLLVLVKKYQSSIMPWTQSGLL